MRKSCEKIPAPSSKICIKMRILNIAAKQVIKNLFFTILVTSDTIKTRTMKFTVN